MRPMKMPYQRLRCCQTNQTLRNELYPRPLLRRSILNGPRRRRVNRQHGHLRAFQRGDDAAERIADFTGEAKAKDGIDDMVGGGEGGGKVIGEGNREGAELGCEPAVDVFLGGFRVEDGGVVAEVVEVPGCY